MKPGFLAAIALVSLLGLAGCDSPSTGQAANSVERAAERAGEAMDDATLTTKVKSALVAEEGVDGTKISVSSNNGQVTLSGSVPADQIARAEAVARKVEGVREVVTQLKPEGASS